VRPLASIMSFQVSSNLQLYRSENIWVSWVNLLPGTHHIKFIVDDQIRLADDLPTAVDDEGSLANYVAVQFSPHSSPHSVSPPNPTQVRHNSFWSETSSSAAHNDGKWTSNLPPELIAAAKEEETYLASLSNSSTSQPAPNIPPAPVLPRHLDKLILNARLTIGSDREAQRERRRKTNRAKDRVSSLTPSGSGNSSPASASSDVIIPVTTASGTDVTATAQHTHPHATRSTSIRLSPDTGGRSQLDGTARMTDDASVLPVPSHVVLRHLSTSAIKNGVLAVADTVRYKKKVVPNLSAG
jgi:5'-AMP-activated protein kinase beta subunit, interaction domain/Glycogen recognition site of AMP-activated protein kinase